MSGAGGTREWDAATYDRVNSPHRVWAGPIIDRLDLIGDETVLDAGCGSGSVTAMVAERVPRGRVIGVDGSAEMIRVARENLGPDAELHVSDLLELKLDEPVDAIFSSATFHWISDHERLFVRLAGCLRPGGRLSAQCGGKGNVAELRIACAEVCASREFASSFADWDDPWTFAGPRETRERLEHAGFIHIETWLEPRPTRIPDDQAREYLQTVNLGSHLAILPADRHESFVDAVIALLDDPADLSYVRLNMTAEKGDA